MSLLINDRLLWIVCYIDVDQIETSEIAIAVVSVIYLSQATIV